MADDAAMPAGTAADVLSAALARLTDTTTSFNAQLVAFRGELADALLAGQQRLTVVEAEIIALTTSTSAALLSPASAAQLNELGAERDRLFEVVTIAGKVRLALP